MSRIFRAYHPYYPYDPYLCEKLNQTYHYYSHVCTIYKSKHGNGGKDHVVQTFWYESKPEILSYLLLSSLLEGERISL